MSRWISGDFCFAVLLPVINIEESEEFLKSIRSVISWADLAASIGSRAA